MPSVCTQLCHLITGVPNGADWVLRDVGATPSLGVRGRRGGQAQAYRAGLGALSSDARAPPKGVGGGYTERGSCRELGVSGRLGPRPYDWGDKIQKWRLQGTQGRWKAQPGALQLARLAMREYPPKCYALYWQAG